MILVRELRMVRLHPAPAGKTRGGSFFSPANPDRQGGGGPPGGGGVHPVADAPGSPGHFAIAPFSGYSGRVLTPQEPLPCPPTAARFSLPPHWLPRAWPSSRPAGSSPTTRSRS